MAIVAFGEKVKRPAAIAAAMIVSFVLGALFHRAHQFWTAPPDKPVPEGLHIHDNMTSVFRTFPSHGDIVVAGDSLIQMADWQGMFPGADIIDRGIPYETSARLRARMDTVRDVNAKKVFLLVGANDVVNDIPVEDTYQNYVAIVTAAQNSAVFVIETPFLGRGYVNRNPEIVALNQKMRAFCAAGRCTFIALNSALAPEGALSNDLSEDGVHLNGRGAAIFRDALKPYIVSPKLVPEKRPRHTRM